MKVCVGGWAFVCPQQKQELAEKKKINVYKKLAGRRSPQSAEKGKV